jgi:hypothetical protein
MGRLSLKKNVVPEKRISKILIWGTLQTKGQTSY